MRKDAGSDDRVRGRVVVERWPAETGLGVVWGSVWEACVAWGDVMVKWSWATGRLGVEQPTAAAGRQIALVLAVAIWDSADLQGTASIAGIDHTRVQPLYSVLESGHAFACTLETMRVGLGSTAPPELDELSFVQILRPQEFDAARRDEVVAVARKCVDAAVKSIHPLEGAGLRQILDALESVTLLTWFEESVVPLAISIE